MPSLNLCQFIGNLGADPELRYTASGRPVCHFRVAVNRAWQENGEWKQATEWISCVVWGDAAERAAEQLRKGMLVYVQGRQETQTWTDAQTGEPRSRVVHVLSAFQRLEKAAREPDVLSTLGATEPRSSSPPSEGDVDDLPF